jgi:hypothetical protein
VHLYRSVAVRIVTFEAPNVSLESADNRPLQQAVASAHPVNRPEFLRRFERPQRNSRKVLIRDLMLFDVAQPAKERARLCGAIEFLPIPTATSARPKPTMPHRPSPEQKIEVLLPSHLILSAVPRQLLQPELQDFSGNSTSGLFQSLIVKV